jgi:hypothetical protein
MKEDAVGEGEGKSWSGEIALERRRGLEMEGALNVPSQKFRTKKFVPSFSNSLIKYTPPNLKYIYTL